MTSQNPFTRIRILVPLLLLLAQAVRSQDSDTLEPTTTPYGTAGMSQVISAEPLGAGRLSMHMHADYYQQQRNFTNAPVKNAQITTADVGGAFGLNSYIDGFAAVDVYNLRNNGTDNGSGAGTTVLGLQGSLPLENIPLQLGLQVASLFGTAGNQIDGNRADGYDYLETRKYTDLQAKLTQSLIFMGDLLGFKLHLNEGVVSSFQPGKDIILVTGVGTQFFVVQSLVLGLELNDRTFMAKPLNTDPLWITPSLVFRTPVNLNIELGADFSLSKDRGTPDRALEPWRASGGISWSFDTQADKRRLQADKRRLDSLERISLENAARSGEVTRDSLLRADSLDKARQRADADSLAAKARQDSSDLIAAQRALAEERSKRSEEEKQLLNTGLLLLDAVYFETGKTEISINSKPYLNIIAGMLTKYPKLQIEVSGHTDNVGGMDYNMKLSQGRAEEVMLYLSKVAPDLQSRLTAKGYGYTMPKADNHTAEGRKFNRRTELQVLNKEVLKEYNP